MIPMDTASLKRLQVGSQQTFDKMLRWGWCDTSARPLEWSFWCNCRLRENIGRASERFVPRPYTKSAEERNVVLRHDYPRPAVRKTDR